MKVPKLNTLLEENKEIQSEERKERTSPTPNQEYSFEQVKQAWIEFAETRKKYKAEYQLLTLEIVLEGNTVKVYLHNPVQETILNGFKTEITLYLRDKLKNNTIQVTGELSSQDDKKVIYTNREKFEHLAEKNPNLKELKARLGLDTDF